MSWLCFCVLALRALFVCLNACFAFVYKSSSCSMKEKKTSPCKRWQLTLEVMPTRRKHLPRRQDIVRNEAPPRSRNISEQPGPAHPCRTGSGSFSLLNTGALRQVCKHQDIYITSHTAHRTVKTQDIKRGITSTNESFRIHCT